MGRCSGRLARTRSSQPRQLDTEDFAIEEQERVERLILGGRRDSLTHRERRQERRDLRGAHFGGMALAVEEDVALGPVDIGLLGPTAVVACANGVADAIEELGLWCLSPGCFAKDVDGRRAIGCDSVSDRSRRGPSVHRTLRVWR